MAPFATVQRAQLVLLAHHHPEWQKAAIAQRLGCSVNTVKRWRQRWQTTDALYDAPRAGTRHTFTVMA
jgi:transposase